MLFITKYKFKGDESTASKKAMMAVFGERGSAPGEIAHYVAADGRGGLVISENDSTIEMLEHSLPYREWMDVEILPVLTLEDALPTVMAMYG